MAHPDLSAPLDWYGEQYAHENRADNSFGLSSLSQTPNAALLSHLRAGGSVVAFIQAQPQAKTNVLAGAYASMEARAAEHRAVMAKLKGGAL